MSVKITAFAKIRMELIDAYASQVSKEMEYFVKVIVELCKLHQCY
jgi:hypothetical protein